MGTNESTINDISCCFNGGNSIGEIIEDGNVMNVNKQCYYF